MGKDLYSKTDKNEFFPTQEFLKNELYSELDKYDFKLILDPCCGDGGLEKFGQGYTYGLYDIEDRGVHANICDFLKAEVDRTYDCAVINPPFGLTVEFVNKAKEFTQDIFLIAPVKTVIKNFGEQIKWYSIKVDYGYKCFGIMTTVGLFHLHFKGTGNFTFGAIKKPTYADFLGPQIPIEDSWETHFVEVDKAPNKFFIVDRLTKARVVRYEKFIKDDDLYQPNDDSAFIAVCGNINIKAGDRVKRRICTFDTFEEMKAWQEFFNSHEEELRDYMYRYGDTILKYKQKPFITVQNIGEMQRILKGELKG